MNDNYKIKTLVVIDNLRAGGVATSLYNYLFFTKGKQDCHLLVFNEESIDRKRVPPEVEIMDTQKVLHILGKFHAEIKKESFLFTLVRLIMIFVARVCNGCMARNIIWPFVNMIGDFDFALAYAQDDSWKSISKGCVDFVLKKVNSRKKAVIVHCDYSRFGGFNYKQVVAYNQLDYIINVSNSCKHSFDECFPSLKWKSIVCENFINVEGIRRQSVPAIEYERNKINLVSVCRLSEEKGIDRVLRVLGRLSSEGFENFSWYIVGDGPERPALEKMAASLNLESAVCFIGAKNNPYQYMKNASWFVLPSRHEAAPMVFGESVSLGVPILSTETCSAKEMVEDTGWGIVVNNSEYGIYCGIKRILCEPTIHIGELALSNDVNANAYSHFGNLVSRIICKNEE